MQPLGRVVMAAAPIARQKTVARAPRDLVEARLVVAERVPRFLRAKCRQPAVGQRRGRRGRGRHLQ